MARSGRYWYYLEKAEEILREYDFSAPLPVWLRAFYRRHRQMGSTDRRIVRGLVYAFFRIGELRQEIPVRERLLVASLLCEGDEDEQLRELLLAVRPLWGRMSGCSLKEKLRFLQEQLPDRHPDGPLGLLPVFPPLADQLLSSRIDREAFLLAQLIQPRLYVRVRPGKSEVMQQALREAAISFERILPGPVSGLPRDEPEPYPRLRPGRDEPVCLAFKNTTRVNRVLEEQAGKWFEVQDLSSQRIAELFAPVDRGTCWWDCCAGSGGKTLVLADAAPPVLPEERQTGTRPAEPDLELFVSDVRAAILKNLRQRFSRAGLENYHLKQLDLTKAGPGGDYWNGQMFDGIILDAPCSGSGTWSRTPEMKAAFTGQVTGARPGPVDSRHIPLPAYTALQKKIAANVLPSLKPGGALIYITCSVFKAENEDIVSWLLENFSLKLEKQLLLEGYRYRADTLFAARLIKG